MNGIWHDKFQGIIPRQNYTVRFSAGEENGLNISLESAETAVTINFGAIQAVQMLDEGVLLQGVDTEQFKAIREQNFPSTIYAVEKSDFGRFIESQMGSDLFSALNCRQYNIITLNYVIFVVSPWPPEIDVSYL